jgi:hypothetical protein
LTQYYNKDYKDEKSVDKEKIYNDAFEYLAHKVYKIHLQPKPEYQFWLIEEIIRLISVPDIILHVRAFKINLIYSELKKHELPILIIYPQDGQKSAKIVLKYIVDNLSNYSDKIGMDISPRYNHKYDNLIYWANGDGDLKTKLKKKGILDDIFDKECNYAHFKCKDNSCHISV